MTRNGSTVVAFAIGAKWQPGNPIAMVGAHTDSCCLRVKPVSKKTSVGFTQVGVETYGGGIWHSWFDRDLSIAGRVFVKDGSGNFAQKLVKVDKPILRVPTLAIHLNRATEFNPNKETDLFPIAGLAAAQLNRAAPGDEKKDETAGPESEGDKETDFQPLKSMLDRHHPNIVELVARHAGVEVDAVVDFELMLYDAQPACLGGLNDEFIFAARLDNLEMTYCSVIGLVESLKSAPLDDESGIRLISCFDHEEIGSTSAQGANSDLLPAVVRRLSVVPAGKSPGASDGASSAATAYEQTCSTSFLVSADMAHSVHPNYAGKHESNHHPEM